MTEHRLAYLTLEAPRVGQASHIHVTEIIAGLRRRGWNIRLFKPAYTDRATKPGVMGRLLAYVLVQIRMWATHRHGEMIYVRAHFMAFPTAVLAKVFAIPILHEVNGPYEDIFVTYPWLTWFRRPLEAMQRWQYRHADHLMPVTPDLAEWLIRETGHHRVTVIPNGANIELFHPAAPRPTAVPSQCYAIFFGGLARWHGVDTMLAAVMHPDWPADIRLVIIGNGQENDKVQAAADTNPNILFQGYRPYDEIPGWIVGALCGLVPISDPGGRSRTGLFPLKLFETLACGIPAVVSDFPGQADLVREHRCGIVVPADDPGALAQAVAHLASSREEAAAMGRRGAALIAAEHSWDCRAEAVHTLLQKERIGRPDA